MRRRGCDMDYPRMDYLYRHHHLRYERYIECHGLTCQDCRGAGGEIDVISWDLGGPWVACDWCEGTGKMTRWLRGQWLRMKKEEKRA